jgi:hypothetical protein
MIQDAIRRKIKGVRGKKPESKKQIEMRVL